MKKSVLALAVLGSFAGVASAQSSVTMFGVVDLNVRTSATTTRSLLAAQDGMASSRLGFRGVEDLGGGLKASFWLEAALGPDTGTGSSSFGNGDTTTQLPGGGSYTTRTRSCSSAVRRSACRTNGASCASVATTRRSSGTGRCSIRSAPTVSARPPTWPSSWATSQGSGGRLRHAGSCQQLGAVHPAERRVRSGPVRPGDGGCR